MRAWLNILVLAGVACTLLGLSAPARPVLSTGRDTEQRVTSDPSAPAAICSVREGRSQEAARKALLLAILPMRPCLACPLQSSHVPTPVRLPLSGPPFRPRSSRGPPCFA